MKNWEVIVIGAGHAGIEASYSAAKMGCKTLLLTLKKDAIGRMSCNPAIGGIGKGHLVKEIDALGGVMGFLADETAIQFRTLNTKKGAAVQATRCQSDMQKYSEKAKEVLNEVEGLEIMEREVVSFLWNQDKVIGVKTNKEESIKAKAIVLTGGTFLRGKIHIGKKNFEAGRAWEKPSNFLSQSLEQRGIKIGRLKTGTTPRLDKNTIDFERLEIQKGDSEIKKFSFWNSKVGLPQLPCYITYTNKKTHKVIAKNLQKSSIFNGSIQSLGPRYCPSVEDKIERFPEKKQHQIFLEPTSLDSIEIYPNGISTSLPEEVQKEFLSTIEGLEKVRVIRAGYAVEYDFVFPEQLKLTLEMKNAENLFLAGQINGTTGYEEAAAQGLVAGINAARRSKKKEPVVFSRDKSYIGVLIDDIVSKGVDEPYRMFTSRCEYRLLLREDNADERLSELGYKIGLLSKEKYQMFCKKQEGVKNLKNWIAKNKISTLEQTKNFCQKYKISSKNFSLESILKQSKSNFSLLEKDLSLDWQKELQNWSPEQKRVVENDIKYSGYISKQQRQIKQYQKIQMQKIPAKIDYQKIGGLSTEVKEKLQKYQPENLAQCLKISGVTPAAVNILMLHIRK